MTKSPETASRLFDRRTLLTGSLATAAGASRLARASATQGSATPTVDAPKRITTTSTMPERALGKTGYTLPVLGHGGSAMVQSWAEGYGVELPSEDQRVEMVRRGYGLGIRYFDTARGYSESERIMGRALADVRENVYIATKVADPRPEKTRESVEMSLRELGTDYVDCMQIHSPAIERVGYDGGMRIYEELEKLRGEGLLHFIGLTTHVAFETVYRMIDTAVFDQVLLARGYLRKGMDMMLSNQNVEWSERCVARAHELGMGIVVMKVMGLNLLGRGSSRIVTDYDPERRRRLPAAAIRWAMQDERTSILNIGVSVPEDIEDNVRTLRGDLAFTGADRSQLAEYAAKVYQSEYVKSLRVV